MGGGAVETKTTRARLERVRDRGLDVLAGCIGLEASRAVRQVVLFVDDELAQEAEERRAFGAKMEALARGDGDAAG